MPERSNSPTGVGDDQDCDGAAIVVHWGDPAPTLRLVDDLVSGRAFSRVVVVANDGCLRPASLDGEAYGVVTWVNSPRNLGYGAACQLGVDAVSAKNYAFLNNDLVLPARAARKCLAALDRPGVGIAGPVLRRPDGRLQSACGSTSRILQAPRAAGRPVGVHTRCAWVTGAALFARHEVARGVRFDGSYFLGHEDADLCERAALHGWATVCVSDAVAMHAGMTTVSPTRWQYYTVRNRIWFCRRRRSTATARAVWAWSAIALFPRVLVADLLLARGRDRSRSVFRAVVDGWAPLPGFGEPWRHEPVPSRWLAW